MTEQSEDKRRARLINAVLDRVDVNRLLDGVDVNRLLDGVDVNRLPAPLSQWLTDHGVNDASR